MSLKFTENPHRTAGLQLRSNDLRARLRAVINAAAVIAAIGPAGPSALTAYAAGNTTQNSSTTLAGSAVTLDGLGGVSVGFSNGSIQISGATGGGGGGTLSGYAVGNTVGQSSSSSIDARSLSFDGAGIVSVGYSNGSVVISASAAGAADGYNIVSASGNTSGTLTSFTTGTIVLAGGNNITLSQSSNTITISGAAIPAQTNQSLGLYGVGNTTGQSSSSTADARSLSFDGAGIASVGMSGGSVVVSVPSPAAQTNQSIGVYASSQTVGQSSSSTVDARSFTHVGQGAVSVGMSGGSLLISAPNTIAQTNQSLGLYAVGQTTGQSSSTTADARTLSFDGAGAVSVGYSAGSVVISAPNTIAQTNQTDGIYASQNTTGNSSSLTHDARSLTIEGLGAVSVGWSTNNSHLLISAPNTIAQTNQTDGIYASVNTTGNSSSLTHDARSLTIEGLGAVSVGWSSNNSHLLISAPNTIAQTVQTEGLYASGNTTGNSSSQTYDARSLTVEGGGIVSVGWSTNNSHWLISATTSQSNQTEGIYATGNTTGNSSSLTVDARSLTIEGLGIISVGWSTNNSHLLLSVPAGGGGGDGYNIISLSGNTAGVLTTFLSATMNLAGGNNITLSQTSNSVTISAAAQTNQTLGVYFTGNTVGTSSSSTVDARSVSFDAEGGVYAGWQSNSKILVSVPYMSCWEPYRYQGSDTNNFSVVNASNLALIPFNLPHDLSCNRLNFIYSMANNTGATASAQAGFTLNVALYTRMTESTNKLSSLISTSISAKASYNSNASMMLEWNGNLTTSAGSNITSAFSGHKMVTVPLATKLVPGEYWLAISASSSSVGSSNAMAISALQGTSGVGIYSMALGYPGSVSNNSVHPFHAFGIYTVTTAAFPGSVHISQVTHDSGLTPRTPYFNLQGAATA